MSGRLGSKPDVCYRQNRTFGLAPDDTDYRWSHFREYWVHMGAILAESLKRLWDEISERKLAPYKLPIL